MTQIGWLRIFNVELKSFLKQLFHASRMSNYEVELMSTFMISTLKNYWKNKKQLNPTCYELPYIVILFLLINTLI